MRTETRKMQFLYTDGTDAHFMDTQSYEQSAVPEASVADGLRWVLPSEEVEVLYVDDVLADLQVPSAVELSVSETEPGLRGDTASGGGDKPAILESGVSVRVPLFVNVGDKRARRYPYRRVRQPRVGMRRTDQRRAAVFALYQEDVTGRGAAGQLDPTSRALTHELVEGVEARPRAARRA